jgi:hypothetical protein
MKIPLLQLQVLSLQFTYALQGISGSVEHKGMAAYDTMG